MVNSKMISCRLPSTFWNVIDEEAAKQGINFSDALRQLLLLGVTSRYPDQREVLVRSLVVTPR